jgi:TPR repeat protein
MKKLLLAAEQGDTQAQTNLGWMYDKGQGVVQDIVMGRMYLNIAAMSGHKRAIKARGLAEMILTPSQLEKAQDLARE